MNSNNALELYQAGKIKVVCAISHYNEKTLEQCLESIKRMDADFIDIKVISGKTPTNNSFNAALDFALESGADLLFHTAADVIVEPNALIELLKVTDIDEHYSSIARGYDSIWGYGASVGIWMLNLRIISNEFRFNNVFKMDLDFCTRIEDATGKTRTYTDKDLNLGYHHLIWTAEEMFAKYRYALPKYKPAQQEKMVSFLEDNLKINPEDKALLAGMLGVQAANRQGAIDGSKNNEDMHKEFLHATKDLDLEGNELFIDPKWHELGLTNPENLIS